MCGSVWVAGLFFTFVSLVALCRSMAATHLIITRIGPCKPKQHFAVTISEFQISRIQFSYNFSISGKIDIKTNIDNGWTAKMTVEKCLDIRIRETCDLFKSFDVIKDGCNNIEDLPIANIFENSQPRITCPIQAGEYKLVRFPYITRDHFRASKTTKASGFFGYNVNVELSDETTTFGCVNAIFRLWYARNHDWGASQPVGQNEEGKGDKGGDSQVVMLGDDWGGPGEK